MRGASVAGRRRGWGVGVGVERGRLQLAYEGGGRGAGAGARVGGWVGVCLARELGAGGRTNCALPGPSCLQGEAIAVNLREMFGLRVPLISVVIGEGGSGGALAIGCANRNLILENA